MLHSSFVTKSGKQARTAGASQPSIKSAMKPGEELTQRQRTEVTTRIARMPALNFQPYDSVESRGLRQRMHPLEPLYGAPSRSTFSRMFIPVLYSDIVEAVKEQMRADIEEGVRSISSMSDVWTSRVNQCYIGLTCHCPTSGFEMRAYALANQLVTERHTAFNILEHLQTMMNDWELSGQKVLIYVVTDNAQNVWQL